MIRDITAVTIGLIISIWASITYTPTSNLLFIHPANIGMILAPLVFVSRNVGLCQRAIWQIIIGLVLGGAFFIAVRQVEKVDVSFILISSLTVYIFYLLLLSVEKSLSNRNSNAVLILSKKNIITVIAIIALLTVMYRYSYYSMLGIPNKERSLMINGVEIHHINIGIILLLLVGTFESFILSFSKAIYIVLISVAIGSITDQSFYIFLNKTTDKAYGESFSTIGAIILPFFIGIMMLLVSRTHNKRK